MDIQQFIAAAREKGFDTVAALSTDEALGAIKQWEGHLREGDFAGFLCADPREILPGAATVLMLAYPYRTFIGYPDGAGRISGYYVASNKAYRASIGLAQWLCGEGIRAVRTHKLPQKPLARAAGLGRYGRNGLIVRSGSHIVIAAIITDTEIKLPPVNTPVPECEKCGACEKACPTGCLKDGYVRPERCLRAYMTHNEENIPGDLKELMGERLLGCDECANACPGLKRDPVPGCFRELFSWETLKDPGLFARSRDAIAELIGTNEADAIHKSAAGKHRQSR